MDFLFTPEYWHALLSPQAQASLTEKLIVVAVVWAVMGRKVAKRFKELKEEAQSGMRDGLLIMQSHMTVIEKTLAGAVQEIRGVKETVSRDLTAHSTRLTKVESGLTIAIETLGKMNSRLEYVETTTKEKTK